MDRAEYGVQVTRNGYGIHVGTWLNGSLTDLTVAEARELRDKLSGVLTCPVCGAPTNAEGCTVEIGHDSDAAEAEWIEASEHPSSWRSTPDDYTGPTYRETGD